MDISIAHSPDADDLFMFWALRSGALDSDPYRMSFTALDTASLNGAALRGAYDVIAVSAAVYPSLRDTYMILPHGASVGVGYGPRVVTRESAALADLAGMKIGTPGRSTTAASLLRMLVPSAHFIEIPISPFERIFEALAAGEIDAALLIHEGQIDSERRGLHTVVELGSWWQAETGLPLPVGINVIHRRLGDSHIREVSSLIRKSIGWAILNRESLLEDLARWNSERGASIADADGVRRYLDLYANEESAELSIEARRGLEELLFRLSGERLTLAVAP